MFGFIILVGIAGRQLAYEAPGLGPRWTIYSETTGTRVVQRAPALLLARVNVGARVQEDADHIVVPLLAGRDEGGRTGPIPPVDLGTKLQEQSHDIDVIGIGCSEQGRTVTTTPKIDVRSRFQNESRRV